ncbi:MAG: 7TM diverse intracellular signaling domain-containing protein [Bacteroidota bacterium]
MIKLLKIVFFLNLILPLQLLADTAKPLVLEDSRSSYLLEDYLILYGGTDNFNLLSHAEKLVDNQQNLHIDSIDQTQKYLWGYFDIKNNSQKHLNWWINFCNNDYVTVLIEGETYKTGYLVKGSEKPIVAGSYYVPITLKSDQVQRVFFKIEKDFHDFNLNFRIDNEIERINSLWYKKLWAMALQGILLIMAMYGLLIYFRLKEKVYLFYSLYLISTSIFYLFVDSFLREYLIPELPTLSYLGVIALYPSAIFYFHFLKRFIDFKEVKQWLYLLINRTLYVSYFLTSAALITFLTGYEQYLEPLSQLFIVLNATIALVSLAYLAYTKNEMGKYFILGSSFLLISAIVDALLWDSELVWGSFTRLGLVIAISFCCISLRSLA